MSVGKLEEFPFDASGNLMHYPQTTYSYDEHQLRVPNVPVWMEVEPFDAVLRFKGYSRGQSAAYFTWQDVYSDIKYPMFLKQLSELITTSNIVNGVARARWEIIKRGMNYGIQKAGEYNEG